jgi:hypothetical protein
MWTLWAAIHFVLNYAQTSYLPILDVLQVKQAKMFKGIGGICRGMSNLFSLGLGQGAYRYMHEAHP